MEIVTAGNHLIAIYLESGTRTEKTRFLTPPEEPLQMGIGVFAKGSCVEPHRHVGDPAEITEYQEFILMRRGLALAEVFDLEGKKIREFQLKAGDALILFRGGHAFQFLEESELLEVKNGPYKGREKMKQPL